MHNFSDRGINVLIIPVCLRYYFMCSELITLYQSKCSCLFCKYMWFNSLNAEILTLSLLFMTIAMLLCIGSLYLKQNGPRSRISLIMVHSVCFCDLLVWIAFEYMQQTPAWIQEFLPGGGGWGGGQKADLTLFCFCFFLVLNLFYSFKERVQWFING